MVEQRLSVANRIAERSDSRQAIARCDQLVQPVEHLADRGDRPLMLLGRRMTLRAVHDATRALAGRSLMLGGSGLRITRSVGH